MKGASRRTPSELQQAELRFSKSPNVDGMPWGGSSIQGVFRHHASSMSTSMCTAECSSERYKPRVSSGFSWTNREIHALELRNGFRGLPWADARAALIRPASQMAGERYGALGNRCCHVVFGWFGRSMLHQPGTRCHGHDLGSGKLCSIPSWK